MPVPFLPGIRVSRFLLPRVLLPSVLLSSVLLSSVLLSSAVVLAVSAQERSPAPAGAGRSLYVSHCARCHGLAGRGDGHDAADLMVKPPDLTRLHERYGNPLRAGEVAAFIDGRADVAAHGPREMPVWGERFFEGDPGPPRGVESAKRRTIELLVDHLQALQGYEEVRRPRSSVPDRGQSAQAMQSDA